MRLHCPFCGERDSSEYAYLGDAARLRARADESTRESFEAVYLRDNPMGRHEELWYHAFGMMWGGDRGGGSHAGRCSAIPPTLSLPHKGGGNASLTGRG